MKELSQIPKAAQALQPKLSAPSAPPRETSGGGLYTRRRGERGGGER